jgi:hypothetical protein
MVFITHPMASHGGGLTSTPTFATNHKSPSLDFFWRTQNPITEQLKFLSGMCFFLPDTKSRFVQVGGVSVVSRHDSPVRSDEKKSHVFDPMLRRRSCCCLSLFCLLSYLREKLAPKGKVRLKDKKERMSE